MKYLLLTVLLACRSAFAVDVYLRAEVTTLTMPGTGESITAWGFAQDSALGANDGTVSVPGPILTVPPNDGTLVIHLTNHLAESTSVVIPGQLASMTPVRNPNGRIRSFTAETAPGSTGTYNWSGLRPGTYLYQSGTHQAVQVQMGLYGGVKMDAAAGMAYPGVAYDKEVILFYSEMDPALHAAVAGGNYGPGKLVTSTIDYQPKYFLVNGSAYTNAAAPIAAGTSAQRTLIRFLNSGLKTHVPLLQGAYMSVVAEDGNLYPFAKNQYHVYLPAGKTSDAILQGVAPGTYALFDRRLALTNNALSPGGMMTFLSVGARMEGHRP